MRRRGVCATFLGDRSFQSANLHLVLLVDVERPKATNGQARKVAACDGRNEKPASTGLGLLARRENAGFCEAAKCDREMLFDSHEPSELKVLSIRHCRHKPSTSAAPGCQRYPSQATARGVELSG
jgi:hypothetical protein